MCNNELYFPKIKNEDLDEIRKLQPNGWSNIIPYIRLYINSDFCRPIKLVLDNTIICIGASISFGNTYWLAHIIVAPNYRNLGIGSKAVNKLIADIEKNGLKTILLIATDLGEPVYKKAGFIISSEYSFSEREKEWIETDFSNNILKFEEKYRQEVYNLDKRITCEDRRKLLANILKTSLVYVKNGDLLGFYILNFRDGTILARTKEAALELMKLKHSKITKAVLPRENIAGRNFLKKIGFKEMSQAKRMVLGETLKWKPKNIYSRIGGNFG